MGIFLKCKILKENYTLLLTPTKPIPKEWIGELKGKNVLCLASGGGQQGPIFSTLGANVIVFDNSEEQLEERICTNDTLDFGHSLQSQISGQIDAGFVIAGFYEDSAGGDLLDRYVDTFIATRALKL